MAKDILIIDIGSEELSAGVFSRKGPERLACVTVQVTTGVRDAISEALSRLGEQGHSGFQSVTASLPPELFSARLLHLPFSDKTKIDEILGFELEDSFPVPINQLELRSKTSAEDATLVVALEQTRLEEYVDILRGLGLDPDWIGSSLYCKDRLLSRLAATGEDSVYIDENSFVALRHGEPFLFKPISTKTDIALAFKYIEENSLDIRNIYTTERIDEGVLPPGAAVTHVSQFGETGGENGLWAMALAGSALTGSPLNFGAGRLATARAFEGTKKSARLTGALLVAFVVLWAIFLYSSKSATTKEIARIDSELKSAYSELFPEESAIVDPLYQLEIKASRLDREQGMIAGGLDMLLIMERLSSLASAEDGKGAVKLNSLQAHGTKITAKGESRSFDTANKFKDRLASHPLFTDVLITDTATGKKGVDFSINITVKGKEI